jgi:hypothetical protein
MSGRIEIADFRSLARFARRSRSAQLTLAALVVVAAVLAVVLTPRRPSPAGGAILRPGGSAILVVDVSASISTDTYARIAATLDDVERQGGRAGLVLFSDTAYQALPPGTPVRELAGFQRFFVVAPQRQPGVAPAPPPSPWTSSFSGGTRISSGLALALDVIKQRELRRPQVVLVSDLDDDTGDLESLTSVALAFRRLRVPVEVVGLNPSAEDESLVRRLIPPGSGVRSAHLPGERRQAGRATVPVPVVLLVIVLAVALAGLVVLTERLRWAGG